MVGGSLIIITILYLLSNFMSHGRGQRTNKCNKFEFNEYPPFKGIRTLTKNMFRSVNDLTKTSKSWIWLKVKVIGVSLRRHLSIQMKLQVRPLWLLKYYATNASHTSINFNKMIVQNLMEKEKVIAEWLTKLFDLFANGSLVGWLTVWIQLAGWIGALNVTPTALLIINDADVKGIITECCIRCIWWTSPAFNSRCWKTEMKFY